MNPSIQGYAAAVLAALDAEATATVASELGALDVEMLSNGDLRAAMTDTSISGTARREVLAALLSHRVSAPTVRIAGYAAFASHAQDVPGAIASLAHRARLTAEDGHFDEASLSATGARQRVAGYATAIYEELSTRDLEEIEDELFRFARTVEGNAQLRGVLQDRDVPVAARQALIHRLLEGKVSSPRPGVIEYVISLFTHREHTAPTISLLDYVVAGGRSRDVVGTIDFLVEQTAKARGWRVARVRTAKALDAAQTAELERSLSAIVGNPVELQVTDDPGLLGGVRIEVGDLLVDASARHRLDQLREHLDAERKAYQKND
jgi:F-type H+-transporting ATPase subunit delta